MTKTSALAAVDALPLPEDLFQAEILVRLPAKDHLRCGAVCRSWRGLTSAADFLVAHHRRQPSRPIVSYDYGYRCTTTATVTYDNDFVVRASCDGLLLLFFYNIWCFAICNPGTRQSIDVPVNLGGFDVAGFYLHSSSGEYRILGWKKKNYNDEHPVCYSSSKKPRCIGLPSILIDDEHSPTGIAASFASRTGLRPWLVVLLALMHMKVYIRLTGSE
ncbi:hypothetical protein PR202_gb06834 [Eleusine coracana subsp. coracana]|uniref:F-box domain-containing protein n=1 Tax=Eleusine coracana subsp. coracana TaxID=191504 RepID=A0AAV5E9T9_ELECO|nr:hypothetical protein PR202_gb06834 [Eleusine coracana subsp. coracana]